MRSYLMRPKNQPHAEILCDKVQEIEKAYSVWRERQDRPSHPNGSFDNKGCWYPSDTE